MDAVAVEEKTALDFSDGRLEALPLERLEGEICELAAHIWAATCRWLCLLAEFERREGWKESDCVSCAQWLSWRCGLAPGAAREQLRVARRLSELPRIKAAFGRGELSYSKVRAVTRVASAKTEEDLLMLAQHATAAQLERLVRTYRGIVVSEIARQNRSYRERELIWYWDDHGSLVIHGRLPAEDGALLLRALEAGRDELRAVRRGERREGPETETAVDTQMLETSDRSDESAETPASSAAERTRDNGGDALSGANGPSRAGRVSAETRSARSVASAAGVSAETCPATSVASAAGVSAETRTAHSVASAAGISADTRAATSTASDAGVSAETGPARSVVSDAGVSAETWTAHSVASEGGISTEVSARRTPSPDSDALAPATGGASAGSDRNGFSPEAASAAAADVERVEVEAEHPAAASNGDALVLMAETLLTSGPRTRSAAERRQVVVHVDAGALVDGDPAGRCELEDGPALPAETARRLACDAALVTILEHQGRPLSVGRKTRAIPPALYRALRSRDGGCRFPGCDRRRFVDAHHIEHWANGGETKLSNLVLLCRHHHRLLHERGYRAERSAHGIVFRRPDGRLVPRVRRPGNGDRARVIEGNRRFGLDIGPETAIAQSGGERMDYDIAIGGLLSLEGLVDSSDFIDHPPWEQATELSEAGSPD